MDCSLHRQITAACYRWDRRCSMDKILFLKISGVLPTEQSESKHKQSNYTTRRQQLNSVQSAIGVSKGLSEWRNSLIPAHSNPWLCCLSPTLLAGFSAPSFYLSFTDSRCQTEASIAVEACRLHHSFAYPGLPLWLSSLVCGRLRPSFAHSVCC